MSDERPLVTIGIPTYNRAADLDVALRSALNQTYPNIEVVVSDNASTDETVAVLAACNDERVRFVRHDTNRGMVANFNACLELAKGAYFLMLSDDDILKPKAVERLLTPMLEGVKGVPPSAIAMAWSPSATIDSGGNEMWTTATGDVLDASVEAVVRALSGTHVPKFCGFLLRTKDACDAGGYQERYGPFCDTANWMQVAIRYPYVSCVQEVLTNYTLHTASETNRSTISVWFDGGAKLLEDLRSQLLVRGDNSGAKRVKSTGRDFHSALIAGVVLQRVGQPGWLLFVLETAMKWPQFIFTPYVGRRLLTEGWKLFSLAGRSEFQN